MRRRARVRPGRVFFSRRFRNSTRRRTREPSRSRSRRRKTKGGVSGGDRLRRVPVRVDAVVDFGDVFREANRPGVGERGDARGVVRPARRKSARPDRARVRRVESFVSSGTGGDRITERTRSSELRAFLSARDGEIRDGLARRVRSFPRVAGRRCLARRAGRHEDAARVFRRAPRGGHGVRVPNGDCVGRR